VHHQRDLRRRRCQQAGCDVVNGGRGGVVAGVCGASLRSCFRGPPAAPNPAGQASHGRAKISLRMNANESPGADASPARSMGRLLLAVPRERLEAGPRGCVAAPPRRSSGAIGSRGSRGMLARVSSSPCQGRRIPRSRGEYCRCDGVLEWGYHGSGAPASGRAGSGRARTKIAREMGHQGDPGRR
jgi:hypothetical protein